jgi:hypothetical protein
MRSCRVLSITKHQMVLPALILMAILAFMAALMAAAPARAGWGDTLKQAGTQVADEQATAAGLGYTPSEAVSGIKQVLSLGADSAVSTLGAGGGFTANPALSIGLPESLGNLPGGSGLTSLLNSAAESAVPSVGPLFQSAIAGLDVGNPAPLISSGNDAITRYFESASRDTLKRQAKPLVGKSLDAAGLSSYASAIAAAQQAAGAAPLDMSGYVTDKLLDSMFSLMGQKEASIRSSGGAGTTELLQKLF